MIGILSWLGSGLIAGSVTAWQMEGRDMGLILFTIAVGLGGSLVGGFLGSMMGVGGMATFSLLSLLFAGLGAIFTLLGYRKLIAN